MRSSAKPNKPLRPAQPAKSGAPAAAVAVSASMAPLLSQRAGLAIAGALGALFGLHRLIDPDLFLQIAVGRAILADPRSIGISTFIEGFPGYSYVEDKWLASVIVALMDALGGENAIMLYQIALTTLVAIAWYGMQRRWEAAPAAAVAGAALGLLTCSFRLEPRPDTISHALLALTIGLVATKLPPARARLVFPLLLLLWVNLHGYFVNGLLVLLAAAIAVFLKDRDLARDGSSSSVRDGFTILGVSLAACFLHPQGWHAVFSPVTQLMQLDQDPEFRAAIQELKPSLSLLANVGGLRFGLLALSAAVAATAGTMQWGRSPLRRQLAALGLATPWILWPPEGLAPLPYRVSMALWIMALIETPAALRDRKLIRPMLFAGFTILALPLVRNIPMLTPVSIVLVTPAWTAASMEFGARATHIAWRPIASVALGLLVVAIGWLRIADRVGTDVRAPSRTGWGIDRQRFPEGAIQAFSQDRLPGPILNNFDAGGYLLYRLHPAGRAFIAGNTSMFPGSFLAYYRARATGATPDVQGLVAAHGVTHAVLDLASAGANRLAASLFADPAWRLVFLDRGGAWFARADQSDRAPLDIAKRAQELAAAPAQHSVLPTWLGGKRLAYPELNLGVFFFNIGRPELAFAEAVRVWAAAPVEDVAVLGGRAAQQAGRLPQFLPQLEDATARFPDTPELKGLLFMALAFRADRALANPATLDDAERDLRRMLELQPGNCGPYTALAKAYALRGNGSEAKRWLGEGTARDRDGACGRMVAADPALAALLR